MNRKPLLLLMILCLPVFSGCASRSGCTGEACKRAESNDGSMVIWWSPAMRAGLGTPEHPVDHSVVPLEN
jgi:hypothetical protein